MSTGLKEIELEGGSKLVYNAEKGNYRLDGIPILLVPLDVILEMFSERERIFSTGSRTICMLGGESVGRVAVNSLRTIASKSMEPRRVVKEHFNSVSRWGYGRFILKKAEFSPNLYVSFEHLDIPRFEAASRNQSFISFLKGFFKAIFQELFHVNVVVNHRVNYQNNSISFVAKTT